MAQVDVVIDTVQDLDQERYKGFFEKDEAKKAELMKTFQSKTVTRFMKIFAEILGKEKWMVGPLIKLAVQTYLLSYTDSTSNSMVKYTVIYFESPGRAEVTRLALAAAGADFEDVRLTSEEWQKRKPNTPQGQLPILEVEYSAGKKVTFPQSGAIARCVARDLDLYGKTPEENTEVDVVLETLNDLFNDLIKIFFEKDEKKKDELKAALGETVIPKYVEHFENIKGKKEWMVGSAMTIADLAVFSIFDQLPVTFGENSVKRFRDSKTLPGLSEKVAANENVKKYLEKRPKPKSQ
ncbi:S-crystallin SL11-like [Ylistrum balloti]|uniref:S-crystallin SL11-like n=1 Tax=Ylistrum balloti TaxID=509963 RepID=UPI002905DE9D|nr:S-crystallin SL11-like [Ylistrum balloti]